MLNVWLSGGMSMERGRKKTILLNMENEQWI